MSLDHDYESLFEKVLVSFRSEIGTTGSLTVE